MKVISAITSFFSHSNYGKKHLKDKLQEQEDKRSLVSFGATRFSTFADQASSVTRCFPAMEKCYSEGLITFDTKAESFTCFTQLHDLTIRILDQISSRIFRGKFSCSNFASF
jgi:hypothetical protein